MALAIGAPRATRRERAALHPDAEQRQHARVPATVRVTIETERDFYAGLSGDLGFGGVFFVSDDPPPPGTVVRLSIRLPTGGTVRAEGCVRWTRSPEFAAPELPAGCGVAWRSLDERSTQAVRRFIEHRHDPRPTREPDAPGTAGL